MSEWVLAPDALRDLEEILEYIDAESGGFDAADRVFAAFREAFSLLATSPNIGHKRTLTGPEIRWWRVYKYLVVYKPEPPPIRILRIVHGARDLSRLFLH